MLYYHVMTAHDSVAHGPARHMAQLRYMVAALEVLQVVHPRQCGDNGHSDGTWHLVTVVTPGTGGAQLAVPGECPPAATRHYY